MHMMDKSTYHMKVQSEAWYLQLYGIEISTTQLQCQLYVFNYYCIIEAEHEIMYLNCTIHCYLDSGMHFTYNLVLILYV